MELGAGGFRDCLYGLGLRVWALRRRALDVGVLGLKRSMGSRIQGSGLQSQVQGSTWLLGAILKQTWCRLGFRAQGLG